MRASVVVRSKDEAARLQLTLASLARQTEAAEVVVVNDGSRDHTAEVIDAASAGLRLLRIDHAEARGRSAASNAGAAAASGDILIFLDGDTLAAPDLVERHLGLHRAQPGRIARGETFHLRCTRFLANPETGEPRPEEAARISGMSPAERARLRVTLRDVMKDFASIERRAQRGIYPGAGPRLLWDIEMDALRNHGDCSVLWAAASGANLSVNRRAFLEAGGFHPDIDTNEHREAALRLCQAGLRMAPVDGARTYHLTHRTGWRDPLTETAWEDLFYQAHPLPEVALLSVLWASLADRPTIPAAARITSLPALAEAARRVAGVVGIEAVKAAHLAAARAAA